VQYQSGEDYMKDRDDDGELRSCFNLRGMMPVGYKREPDGVFFGNQDLDKKQNAEIIGGHLVPFRKKPGTPITAARPKSAYVDRVKEMYRAVDFSKSDKTKKQWMVVMVDELVSAANPYATGCPHYLEPLYYYGKRLKPIHTNQYQCPTCKKVFSLSKYLGQHIDHVHSFKGLRKNEDFFMKS